MRNRYGRTGFFNGYDEARQLYYLIKEIISRLGPFELKVTKSQVAFARRRQFAWVWIPARYLSGNRPPLVLSLSLSRTDSSPRWKEVVEPAPGSFMHHLEVYASQQLDAQVQAWLQEAYNQAG